MSPLRPATSVVIAVSVIAMAARGAACLQWPAHLSDDRDAYLGIAANLAAGRGFSVPNSTTPTAYRPPLYPLILAPISGADQAPARAVLHCVLGGITAALVAWLAAISGLPASRQFVAGLIVAIDPLLVYYASFPMTETLATALAAGLLSTAAAACRSRSPAAQRCLGVIAGVLFGLCVLCRPTFWAFAVCVVAFGIVQALRTTPSAMVKNRPRMSDWVLSSLVTAAVIAPWVLRNARVMGRPIVTTTHGGYTLLLSNNPAYYREVVDQPWGVIWDGSRGPGQEAWIRGVLAEMSAAGVQGEVPQDRWMRERAIAAIRHEPATFLRACVRRFASLWSVRPHGASQDDQPRGISIAVAGYYSLLWLLGIVGGWRALRRGGCAVELSSLMVAAVVAVHLVYWTDARMRAPIMPSIALFVAWAGARRAEGDEPGGVTAER